jgi:DNA ligase 1
MSYIDTLIGKITTLENTPGKNDKLTILKTLETAELHLFQLALDPTINFYIAKLPPVRLEGHKPWTGDVFDLLHNLAQRRVTGNAARNEVVATLETLKPDHAVLLSRVILKDLRCGVGSTLVNAVFPGAIPEFPYMRCSLPSKSNMPKWDDTDWSAGILSQEKADGMFASLSTAPDGRVSLLSRQGSRFPSDALPHLHVPHERLKGHQLHGELLVLKDGAVVERQIGNGLLNSLLQGGELPDDHEVEYLVWDSIPLGYAVPSGKYEARYEQRLVAVEYQISEHPHIFKIPTRIVRSEREAMEHYKELLAQGKEGTILKHPEGIWKDTTSKDCVKLKLEVDVDLLVTGFTPGNGKNAATFGSLSMSSQCGQLSVDVSGFTDAKRKELHDIGQNLLGRVMTVRANGVLKPGPNNDKHSLFLPRFVEERLDKCEADDLLQIEDQFANAVGR